MKSILLIIILLITNITNSYSQDIIKLKNKETIQCKVTKVGENLVEYRRSDNPDGPIYEIRKDKIQTIYYKNNSIDNFTIDKGPIDSLKIDSLKNLYNVKFGIGLTLGYNATSIRKWRDDLHYTPGSGFNAGVTCYIPLIRGKMGNLYLQPSILYSRESTKEELTVDVTDIEHNFIIKRGTRTISTTIKHNNIKVPAFVGYEFNLCKNFSVGPRIGIAFEYLFRKGYSGTEKLDLIESLSFAFYKKYRIDIGYQTSMNGWNNYSDFDRKWTNINFNISYIY